MPGLYFARASSLLTGLLPVQFNQYDLARLMTADEKQDEFLDALRTFVRVRGMENIKQAEEQLGKSHGTIGKYLKAFNEALDAKVTKRGVDRSDLGERIAPEAESLLEELEAQLDSARDHLRRLAAPCLPVQVAMSPTIWMWGSEKQLVPLTHSLPTSNAVEFLVANSERVERAVLDGWFEIGITAFHPDRGPHPRLSSSRFCADEIVLALPPDHEWSRKRKVPVGKLAETPLITLDTTANARVVVDHALKQHGHRLVDPHEQVAMAVMVFEQVLETNVPALVSKLAFHSPQGKAAAQQGLTKRSISGVDLSRDFHLIHDERLRPEAQTVKKKLLSLIPG